MDNMNISSINDYLLSLQDKLCFKLSKIDGKNFRKDDWSYLKGKGGGKTYIIENGNVIERCGVNYSFIESKSLPDAVLGRKPELQNHGFQAAGLSLVIHPKNPYAPTSHLNVRFFLATKINCQPIWWFGGGFDLTPSYGFEEDCRHWHNVAYNACKSFGSEVYAKYKAQCDSYFYLPHRGEHRGIGGLFFDYLNEWGFKKSFSFARSVGDHYIEAYLPILDRRKNTPYTQKERDFQLYRRSRYAEFNLIYDRGTQFGLQSGGRIESILMSMPPLTKWVYDYKPLEDSKEGKLCNDFLRAKNWISPI